jgi:hypothetical protein
VSLVLAALIVIAADVITVTGMLLVRRRAPSGSYFQDTQQATGVFAVAGTTYAVIVAFVFFLAFQSYNDARQSSEDEAIAVSGLHHTAELFPPASRATLQGDLICYGRAVIHEEWPAMAHRRTSRVVRQWIGELERGFEAVQVRGAKATDAYTQWFQDNEARQRGRRGRLAEAKPFVPPPVWFVLILGGALAIVFVGFFADSRERRLSQAMLMAAITTMVASSLLLVAFLDRPYRNQPGSIRPTAMRESIDSTVQEYRFRHPGAALPCDGHGLPRPGALKRGEFAEV